MTRVLEPMGGLATQSTREYPSAITFGHIKFTSFGHINFVRLSIVAIGYAVCAAISQLLLPVKVARDKEVSHCNYKRGEN